MGTKAGYLSQTHPKLAAAIAVVILLAAVAMWVGRRLASRTLAGLTLSPEQRVMAEARMRRAVNSLRVVVYSAAAIACVFWALPEFGVEVPGWRPRDLGGWVMTHGLRIAAILAVFYVVSRVSSLLIARVEFRSGRTGEADGDPEGRRRAATLSLILSRGASAIIWLIAGLIILREFSVDVVPILTGAGIAGLALGLGAQNLFRDLIAGCFMVFEGQIRIGDVVRINGVAGTVETIGFRTTVIRDIEGAVHVFPNGTIATLSNSSKEFAYALVDIGIGRDSDVDGALATLLTIGSRMQRDPAFAAALLAPLEVMGVEAIGATRVTVRSRFKTAPGKQWDVARELRRRAVSDLRSWNPQVLIAVPATGPRRAGRRSEAEAFDGARTAPGPDPGKPGAQ